MSTTGQVIGKRNKRNPGHCWQDNELYDVFQRVIGALAAHVFAQMTRWCYGHEVRMGLRELADEAGVSRSTAHRATLAMQAMGMIRIREGRGRGSASYELLDLKEAARALGARWEPGRASFVLTASQVRALKKRVAEALSSVPVRDASEGEPDTDSVPVRDANTCGNASVVSQVVSQIEGVCVPNRGGPSITQRHKDIKTKPTPVSPPASGPGSVARIIRGSRMEAPPDAALEAAIGKLCRECDLADERQRRKIGEAIAQYAAKERMSADEAAAAMIEAWREYREAMPMLRFRWGPVKFITHGRWRNPDGWPWEMSLVKQESVAREARVGVAR